MKNLVNSFSENSQNPAKFVWQMIGTKFNLQGYLSDEEENVNNTDTKKIELEKKPENKEITKSKPVESFKSAEELEAALDKISEMSTEELTKAEKVGKNIINKIKSLYNIDNDNNGNFEETMDSGLLLALQ